MRCEEFEVLISGLLDGELDSSQEEKLREHLQVCEKCKRRHQELLRLKEVTDSVRFKDLPEEVWAAYWGNVYRRLERGLGWILFSVGAIILIAFGLYQGLSQFFADPEVSLLVKIGVGGLGFGLIILLVSVIRERIFAYRRDRYREVQR
jgi:predicted anti-sigma-YlaC factor YlaD